MKPRHRAKSRHETLLFQLIYGACFNNHHQARVNIAPSLFDSLKHCERYIPSLFFPWSIKYSPTKRGALTRSYIDGYQLWIKIFASSFYPLLAGSVFFRRVRVRWQFHQLQKGKGKVGVISLPGCFVIAVFYYGFFFACSWHYVLTYKNTHLLSVFVLAFDRTNWRLNWGSVRTKKLSVIISGFLFFFFKERGECVWFYDN